MLAQTRAYHLLEQSIKILRGSKTRSGDVQRCRPRLSSAQQDLDGDGQVSQRRRQTGVRLLGLPLLPLIAPAHPGTACL